MTTTSRICTRCQTQIADDEQCPTCLAEFATRRDPREMTTAERLAEFDSWFLADLPEISNSRVAARVAELVGHPVHPLDVGTREGRRDLRHEIVSR